MRRSKREKRKRTLKKSTQLMCYLKHSIISGPTQGEAPASFSPPPLNFLKKKKRKQKKYTFSNKKNL